MSIASTALLSAPRADPVLAADAVRAACQNIDGPPCSILLFLTQDFSRIAHASVTAAARATGCMNIMGGTFSGVFTEQGWSLDQPAVAALVLGAPVCFASSPSSGADIALEVARATSVERTADSLPLLGACAGDAGGKHARLFNHGKMTDSEGAACRFSALQWWTGASRGVRALGASHEVTRGRGYDIERLGAHAALTVLLRELPKAIREDVQSALHLVFAAMPYDTQGNGLDTGDFDLIPVIALNHEERSLTLARPVAPGARLTWVVRDADAARQELGVLARQLSARTGADACFGVQFTCVGRGPYFHGDGDQDQQAVRDALPGLPLIGAYSSTQIACIGTTPRELQYASVLGLAGTHS